MKRNDVYVEYHMIPFGRGSSRTAYIDPSTLPFERSEQRNETHFRSKGVLAEGHFERLAEGHARVEGHLEFSPPETQKRKEKTQDSTAVHAGGLGGLAAAAAQRYPARISLHDARASS